jgi:hypothetical protein
MSHKVFAKQMQFNDIPDCKTICANIDFPLVRCYVQYSPENPFSSSIDKICLNNILLKTKQCSKCINTTKVLDMIW